MFDVLTYQKGGALLRMLQQYLGEDEFRQGVNLYLRTHAHGNTETGDLWDAIEEANPSAPVRRLMDSWIWQPGFPLISARLDGDQLVLSQQRFTFGDPAALGSGAATLFVVPLHIGNGGAINKILVDGDEVRVDLADPSAAVVVNANGYGFVRVAYDHTLRARLVGETLDSLTVVDRYNLIDDAWNSVVAGRLHALDFLSFAEGFADERELAVWQAIGVGLRGIGRLVEGEAYAAFRARVRVMVAPALDRLGWTPPDGEDGLTAKLRGLLVGMLAVLGDDADAQARCRAIFESPGSADPELVAAATNVVAAYGDAVDFDHFVAGFRTAPTPQEQLRFLYALGEFPEAELIELACEFAFSGEVKTQNAPFLLNRCIANREHGRLAWNVVRQRWAEANERFPGNTIVRMVEPVKLLNKPEEVADVQGFFSEHPIPQAAKTLDQILERQRVNAALREREQDLLREALAG
jgi:puromycin-sensitive aminopeptidase